MLIQNLPLLRKGKVREVYEVGTDKLLLVASDRVSAFDHILPNEIPGKGRFLTQISDFWFDKTEEIVPNHHISSDIEEMQKYLPDDVVLDKDYFAGRTVLAKKADRIDFECVVRGYITGSAWAEYLKAGKACGYDLPAGLQQAQPFPEPLFTPATKADNGHDINISFEEMKSQMDGALAEDLKRISIELYNFAHEYLKPKGIILADTKFEFGIVDGKITLIDEALTPDSSRFWDESQYQLGVSPVSYDKQYIRDYLETTQWDKQSAPPEIPTDIVAGAVKKYQEAVHLVIS